MMIEPQLASSPLVLCDSLLSLAEQADHAGLRSTAEHLLELASDVLDGPIPTAIPHKLGSAAAADS